MVETTSSSEESDDRSKFDTISLMDNKSPLIRLSIFGRLKRMMAQLKGKNLDTTDKRLLKGLYIKNQKDFDEELEDQSHNVTLLSRLKKNLLNPAKLTEPSPRKRLGSMDDESFISSEALPEGLNRLIKKD